MSVTHVKRHLRQVVTFLCTAQLYNRHCLLFIKNMYLSQLIDSNHTSFYFSIVFIDQDR